MKTFTRTLGATAAAAMLLVSTAAAAATANPAGSLSLARTDARAGAPTTKTSKIAEGGTATLINVGILAALVAVVLVATNGGGDDNDDNSDSN